MRSFVRELRELEEDQNTHLRAFKKRVNLWNAAYCMSKDWEELGGSVQANHSNYWITFYGNNLVDVEAFNQLMEYYVYLDKDFVIENRLGTDEETERASISVRDERTGGNIDLDLMKGGLTSCEVITTKTGEVRDVTTRKFICETIGREENSL